MAASLVRTCVLTTRRTLQFLRPISFALQESHDSKRSYHRRQKGFLREMYKKRIDIGPDKPRRRSEWINWNYDCEIFSFGQRLGENFDEGSLRQAFVHRSYVEQEKEKRAELGIDLESVPLELDDNSDLANSGDKLMKDYLKVYLRNIYPYMFEECISSVCDHLMMDETLSHIASHLGCEDLILCQDFPVQPSVLSVTFKAVVGALEQAQGKERAEAFVRDFVLPQLIGKDLNEMWPLHNPMGLLVALLSLTGRGQPEPRLLWKSGSNTMMSLYWVGIYSNKQLISKAPGETVLIAEEMAAREAVKKVMRTEDNRPPLVLGTVAERLELDRDRVNASAEDIVRRHYEQSSGQSDSITSS
ncbi:39S ribosomal protein L44, mitochondrial [Aplysia californica]|uniref:Large ribosomal subunit protein mL44 n=1 Tax=Aplysia californica TaxID=6500 RepID=A0ABM1A6Z4_APLCA|nr:39S ribosomal protein L44, mitochondrial [Aplysia californica]